MPTWPPNHPAPCKGWPLTPPGPNLKTVQFTEYDVLENVTRIYNPLCTPECCTTATSNCPEVDDGCPPTCADGTPATIPPQPRDAYLDPVTGDPTLTTGCQDRSDVNPGTPAGPWPSTVAPSTTYLQGNCQLAKWPPIDCQAGVAKYYGNCYKPNGKKKKFSTCNFTGHKTLLGGKNWHGTIPFGGDGCATIESMGTCGDCPAPDCSSNPLRLTPAGKKYRTVTVTYAQTSNGGGTFHDFLTVGVQNYTATNSVDKWGKITKTASGSSTGTAIEADGSSSVYSDEVSGVPADLNDILTYMTKCAQTGTTHLKSCGPFAPFEGNLTITVTGDYKVVLHFEPNPVGAYGYRMRFDCPDGSTIYGWYALTPPDSPSDLRNCGEPGTAGTVLDTVILGTIWDVTIELSDPYTYNDVIADIRTALATWNLADHHQYPPRTDTITNGGPLLTYNERLETDPFSNSFLDPTGDPWVDPNPVRYPDEPEGEIMGKPLPTGAGPHFDRYHLQWDLNDPDYSIGNPRRFGQWSNASPMNIPHATQWTDELHHLTLPHGPWIFCDNKFGVGAALYYPKLNDNDGTQFRVSCGNSSLTFFHSVMVCTHAQVKIPSKNHNYNRPCGEDQNELDLNSVHEHCLDSDPRGSADKRWPSAPADCDHDNPYWNDPYPKGNFVVKTWGYNFRDWLESYRGIIQAEARAVDNLNRTAAGDSCHPNCPSLTPPDPVRFKKIVEPVDGCTADLYSFTTLDTGEIMADGDATVGGSKWLATQTCTQYCIASTPCSPGMIYIQPAALNELITDPQAIKIDMPALNGDYYYGTLWIARIEQWMTDPLWQLPGKGYEQLICSEIGIKEDDGNCHLDCTDVGCVPQAEYYPQRNYEEAECSKPGGSPDLPPGSRILGCKDYVANLNLDPPVVNWQDAAPGCPECASPYQYFIEFVLSDPLNPCRGGGYQLFAGGNGYGSFGVGFPVQVNAFTPWRWKLDREACIARSGRFAENYLQQ